MVQENLLNKKIEKELVRLSELSIAELRVKYQNIYNKIAPHWLGPDLLRRSIGYRIQEKAFGGLKPAVQQELDRLVSALSKNPLEKIQAPRRIKPGSVLVRKHQGKSHRVTVNDNGFIYDGETFATLSEIAEKITGTHWNGPRFFGLRKFVRGKLVHK